MFSTSRRIGWSVDGAFEYHHLLHNFLLPRAALTVSLLVHGLSFQDLLIPDKGVHVHHDGNEHHLGGPLTATFHSAESALILSAILVASSATNESYNKSLFAATTALPILLLIALICHLVYCYRNRIDIFEVAGSALIYLTMMAFSGFCTFVVIRWRIFVNLRRKVRKQSVGVSKEAGALSKQEK
ncbi:unnamed protein product [Litomosoides sigmodontis]|uniref:Uncharacterized protein n=1 Tax=Litomosoides sigmodontis TaxID=42156 RepID=A0A3P6SGF1_LITSI|nr:unnamed protein product [Litomosoides sigmodontis]